MDNQTVKRFISKFTIGDGCWQWTASTRHGYGQFKNGSAGLQRAHRVSYELFVGPIPSGKHIDHVCNNRGCVNPVHLEPVTQAENNRRAGAIRSARTHCPKGHAYSYSAAGKKSCKECKSEYDRLRYNTED